LLYGKYGASKCLIVSLRVVSQKLVIISDDWDEIDIDALIEDIDQALMYRGSGSHSIAVLN